MGHHQAYIPKTHERQIWRSWDRASWYISIVKPTRCIIFEFIGYHSACFGRSFRLSSWVQDCTYSIRYMSNRFCWLLASGPEMEPQILLYCTILLRWFCTVFLWCFYIGMFLLLVCSISGALASTQLTCMTYTWCCVYSLELLMMNGKTVRNM